LHFVNIARITHSPRGFSRFCLRILLYQATPVLSKNNTLLKLDALPSARGKNKKKT